MRSIVELLAFRRGSSEVALAGRAPTQVNTAQTTAEMNIETGRFLGLLT